MVPNLGVLAMRILLSGVYMRVPDAATCQPIPFSCCWYSFSNIITIMSLRVDLVFCKLLMALFSFA